MLTSSRVSSSWLPRTWFKFIHHSPELFVVFHSTLFLLNFFFLLIEILFICYYYNHLLTKVLILSLQLVELHKSANIIFNI